jgi:hypothetical protein
MFLVPSTPKGYGLLVAWWTTLGEMDIVDMQELPSWSEKVISVLEKESKAVCSAAAAAGT